MIDWLISIFDKFAVDRHEKIKTKIHLLKEERHFQLAQNFPVEDIDKIDIKIAELQKKLNKGR